MASRYARPNRGAGSRVVTSSMAPAGRPPSGGSTGVLAPAVTSGRTRAPNGRSSTGSPLALETTAMRCVSAGPRPPRRWQAVHDGRTYTGPSPSTASKRCSKSESPERKARCCSTDAPVSGRSGVSGVGESPTPVRPPSGPPATGPPPQAASSTRTRTRERGTADPSKQIEAEAGDHPRGISSGKPCGAQVPRRATAVVSRIPSTSRKKYTTPRSTVLSTVSTHPLR